MLRKLSALCALFLWLAPLSAAADEPIPIEQEPRHWLRFENEHVRFFDTGKYLFHGVDIRFK